MYINNENNPKNFAIDCVKLAPKKNLNNSFIEIYKFEEGVSHIAHASELIKEKQFKFCKL